MHLAAKIKQPYHSEQCFDSDIQCFDSEIQCFDSEIQWHQQKGDAFSSTPKEQWIDSAETVLQDSSLHVGEWVVTKLGTSGKFHIHLAIENHPSNTLVPLETLHGKLRRENPQCAGARDAQPLCFQVEAFDYSWTQLKMRSPVAAEEESKGERVGREGGGGGEKEVNSASWDGALCLRA